MAKKVNLRFVGPQHYREISKDDWKAAGITGQDGIYAAGENAYVRLNDYETSQVVSLTPEAAEFLMKTEGDLWEETDLEAGISPIHGREDDAEALRQAAIAADQEESGTGGANTSSSGSDEESSSKSSSSKSA